MGRGEGGRDLRAAAEIQSTPAAGAGSPCWSRPGRPSCPLLFVPSQSPLSSRLPTHPLPAHPNRTPSRDDSISLILHCLCPPPAVPSPALSVTHPASARGTISGPYDCSSRRRSHAATALPQSSTGYVADEQHRSCSSAARAEAGTSSQGNWASQVQVGQWRPGEAGCPMLEVRMRRVERSTNKHNKLRPTARHSCDHMKLAACPTSVPSAHTTALRASKSCSSAWSSISAPAPVPVCDDVFSALSTFVSTVLQKINRDDTRH